MFSKDKKKELIQVLEARLSQNKTKLKCPMCSNRNFTIADAYLRNDLQPDIRNVNLGGPSIPAIAIICTNCGFISQHAIGALGLMPKEEENDG